MNWNLRSKRCNAIIWNGDLKVAGAGPLAVFTNQIFQLKRQY